VNQVNGVFPCRIDNEYNPNSVTTKMVRYAGMISREVRWAKIPAIPGRIAVPKPAAPICMPIVFAVYRGPTRPLVPETKPGKMGAIEKPMMTTPNKPNTPVGFHQRSMAPPNAASKPTRIKVWTPIRFA